MRCLASGISHIPKRFTDLSLIHIYWLFGGRVGQLAAIPEIDGKLAFQPSTEATLMVAIGPALRALLIAAMWEGCDGARVLAYVMHPAPRVPGVPKMCTFALA